MVRYYLTQDHFHYDDSGYYGYILFSGTKAELHGLLNGLGAGIKNMALAGIAGAAASARQTMASCMTITSACAAKRTRSLLRK